MDEPNPSKKRHRISFDVEPGFDLKVKHLAARWATKTNVAVQRAVDIASTSPLRLDEKALLQTLVVKVEEIARQILPP